jgi:DmsE family decaheme c-type cytochrome
MRRILFCTAILLLLAGLCGVVWVDAVGEGKRQASKDQNDTTNADDNVGSEICETCHAEVVKGFSDNPHSKLALMHEGKGVTCETCHGSGKEHVESGGEATKIFPFSKASAKVVDEKCLTCHAKAHPSFERSAHGEAAVGCESCHSVHKSKSEEDLLKISQPKLCYTCHTDIKPAFVQPFHHKVDEGLISCSDCHNPHGTFKPKQLRSSVDGDAVCVKCHTQIAGPFVYEHPPVKIEGCITCHFPHGSPNPRLLNRSNVNTLCLQCHSALNESFTAPGTPSFHNMANQYQACTVCHTQIHGSNSNAAFFH